SRFDLDDVGAGVGQRLPALRAGDAGGAFGDTDARKHRRAGHGESLAYADSSAPPCASRCRVVECTGSVSNVGSTCLPNVSTASMAISRGIVVDSIPKTSWSAPMSAKPLTPRSTSSGVPMHTSPESIAAPSVYGVGSGISTGHAGRPGGFGNVSRYRNTRLFRYRLVMLHA